jgi:hypothetical protein
MGRQDAARANLYLEQDELRERLADEGIAWTRENFINAKWPDGPPDPWTAEDKDDVPPELQDWSRFEP